MKGATKGVCWLLGGWFCMYIVLCCSYATIHPNRILIFNDQVFRTILAIISIAVVLIFYLANLSASSVKPTSQIIQRGGTKISDATWEDIHKDIRAYHGVYVTKTRHHEYLIQIYDERE